MPETLGIIFAPSGAQIMNTNRRHRKELVVKNCIFCKEKKNPDFLEYEILTKYTTERGKILSRARTGLCSKHQRRVTQEIKRARHMAFLPFILKAE